MPISKHFCRICGKQINPRAKYTCSKACAAELRNRQREQKDYVSQPDQEWPAWMFHEKPFLRHDVDPGDGLVLRLPGANPERSRGLLGSSASFAVDRGNE